MYKSYLKLLLTITLLISGQSLEAGVVSTLMPVTKNKAAAIPASATKRVYLMDIPLTTEQKEKILKYNPMNEAQTTFQPHLPSRALLNMDKLPVLDQGAHGTCVTFATTAAVDFLLGKGDYISQLCSLELNAYLAEKSIHPQSTWHGTALSSFLLNQLYTYGIVTKEKQKMLSCGGLFEYPLLDSSIEGESMPLDEFIAKRETVGLNIGWQLLLTMDERLETNPSNPKPYQGSKVLERIKRFLTKSASQSKTETPKGILTFGVVLPIDYCHVGACASFHKQEDTWVLLPEMQNLDPSDFSLPSHEMIIYGYDDDAIAIDNEGQKHRGLLFLRNSWSDEVGDQGNFYMSYDFFKKFVLDVQMLYKPTYKAA